MSDELHQLIAQVLLPTELDSAHFEIAAALDPATDVGGDYYDVIHIDDVCWLAIGDVAGSGMRTALITLMAQSVVAAAVRTAPASEPSAVLAGVNRALWSNIRERLHSDEHMTATLLRCGPDGRVRFAGAHEDLIVARAAGGPIETIETFGTWLGASSDVSRKNPDHDLVLAHGDVLVLFTDGLTEARDAAREQFGLARLTAIVDAHRAAPVREIRDAIFAAVGAWGPQVDDITVVVARYRAT